MFLRNNVGIGQDGPSTRNSRKYRTSGGFVSQTYPNRLRRNSRRSYNFGGSVSKIGTVKSTPVTQRISMSTISPLQWSSSSSWRSKNNGWNGHNGTSESATSGSNNDHRVPVTTETMEAIQNEINHSIHLPCTIFFLANCLKDSEIVMTMHEHSNQLLEQATVPSPKTKWTDVGESFRTHDDDIKETSSNGTNNNINPPDNDMSMLLSRFGNLDLVNNSGQRITRRIQNGKMKTLDDESALQLKNALGSLSNSLGATKSKVTSWEEAKQRLSKVILFPSSDSGENQDKNSHALKSTAVSASEAEEGSPSLSVLNRKRPHAISNKQQDSSMIRKSPQKTPSTATKPLFSKKSRRLMASGVRSNISLQKYMDIVSRVAKQSGVLNDSASTWAQVKFYPTGKPSTQQNDENKGDVEKEATIEALEIKSALDKKKRKEDELEKQVQAQMEAKAAALAAAAEKEKEEAPLLPLTPEESAMVKDILYGRPAGSRDDDIVSTVGTDSIQRGSIRKLQPGCWLNDEVIHFFLSLLASRDEQLSLKDTTRKRSHFFKSFFITKLLDDDKRYNYKNVKRWSKKVPGKDIFGLDKIICPVNLGNTHWCCAVIFMSEKKIQFYDSMGGGGRYYIDSLFKYVQDEHMDKKKNPLPSQEEWQLVECQPDTPQQSNGFDCGVFTCAFADFLSRDAPLNFTQSHVTELRERIALAIIKNDAMI